jgi:hypothetical protein
MGVKESFIPLGIVFTAGWWFSGLRTQSLRSTAWILSSWLAAVASLSGLQWWIRGSFLSPVQFGLDLHLNSEYLRHFVLSMQDRNFWYIFAWLLPTSLPNLGRFPRTWLIPTGAASAMTIILDAYFGGAPGTLGRALFSVAGPILSLSSALLLLKNSDKFSLSASEYRG